MRPNRIRIWSFVWPVLVATWVGFGVWFLFNRQYVLDLYEFWTYTPTAAVQQLADEAQLSEKGKFYFYVGNAEINDSLSFNNNCLRQEDNNPILGCYTSGNIYIYNVTNKKLDGIQQVTAAHEMLHVVWERLSEDERARLELLLEKEYDKQASKELKDRMDYYRRAEPGELLNELHSIVGTEFESVSDELEEYYGKYFSDRVELVGLYKNYYSVFEELDSQAKKLYDQLTSLAKTIDKLRAQYEKDADSLNDDIDDFNTRADNGSFASVAQFNAERADLISRSNQLDIDYDYLSYQIGQYNSKLKQYNKIALQQQELNSSIDSTSLSPVPSL